jgi:manganese transport protein
VPLVVRSTITMIPALVVLAVGIDPTSALVAVGVDPTSALAASQVVLSFGIPFALVPLVLLTGRRDVMGTHVNGRWTTVAAWATAVMVVGLNVFLLAQQAAAI